jgi:release factor glutamine methyltransferase
MENLTAAANDAGRRGGALLRQAVRRLSAAGIESGARDAEVLLAHALGVGREQVIARTDEPVDDRRAKTYEQLLLRRLEREPTAYITGAREFWSLVFHVTPDVLIPRPETELLVEIALELARQRGSGAPLRIVDVGTGSGAIAVALASELENAKVLATDVSAGALALARANAERNHVGKKIRFVEGDLFDAVPRRACYDFIVSNPPYIRSADIAALEPEVRRWEPRAALDGGADGLDFYRRITLRACDYLAPGGVLLVEIGAGTGEIVERLFQDAPGWGRICVYKDYAGRQRAVTACKIAGAQ